MFKILAIAAFMLVSTEPPQIHAYQEASAAGDDQKVICKTKPRTNSRFGKRTCLTRAEWNKRTEQHKRDAAEMINRPIICTGKEGC
jgi:hypothetical protein